MQFLRNIIYILIIIFQILIKKKFNYFYLELFVYQKAYPSNYFEKSKKKKKKEFRFKFNNESLKKLKTKK